MRVTIDFDRDIIIIPDNFFKKIGDENDKPCMRSLETMRLLVAPWGVAQALFQNICK